MSKLIKPSRAIVIIGGCACLVVSAASIASAGSRTGVTVETIRVPISPKLTRNALSPEQMTLGRTSVEKAIARLRAVTPTLPALSLVGDVSPVYLDENPSPVAVSAVVGLPKATDVTLDLVATVADATGRFAPQIEKTRVSNLRALSIQVSLSTGEISNLSIAPLASDVAEPGSPTVGQVVDTSGKPVPAGPTPKPGSGE
jgi:hypothetical protein